MSNVAIAHPNRLLEYKALHYHDVDWNMALPLENILTDVLPETARTTGSTKRTSFGISLSALPYRNLNAIALVNHNLSVSAKVRFTVFNEPPIDYVYQNIVTGITQTSITLNTTNVQSGDLVGNKIRIYGYTNSRDNVNVGSYYEGDCSVHNVSTGSITIINVIKVGVFGSSTIGNWIVFDLGTNGKIISIQNQPTWLDCWQRIYPTTSNQLTWRSRNFWRGTVELEIMELVTKVHISFLSPSTQTNYGDYNQDVSKQKQVLGTHLHIDIDDSTEPETWSDMSPNLNYKPYIEIGRVFMGGYMEATINPEYGSITHGVKDNTEFQQSDSGQKFFHEKSRARTASIQWNHLDKDEAFGSILLSQLQQGISREVLYTYSVEKIDSYQLLQSFIGRYVDLNPIQQPNVGMYSVSINLEEIL
jgi:hypothetical protein